MRNPMSLCLIMMLILCLTQGSSIVTLATVVRSVKVLDFYSENLSLDAVINLIRCFPCLEKLYIQVTKPTL
jgi:hypothetical protein